MKPVSICFAVSWKTAPNHAWVQDASGRLVFYNREASRFFGITPTEWLGRSMDEVLSGPEALRFQSQDEAVLASGTIFESIDEITGKDGRIRKLKSVKFSYTALDGKRMLARISEDITDKIRQSESLAQAHAELELIATTDFLTGLSTRRVFSFRAEAEFSHWTRHNSPFCILIMDLDNFKQRNDRFGHAAGDEALALVGQVLRNCLRTGDLAARMGGEEFGVLLPHTDLDGARDFAIRFRRSLQEQDHGPLPLTASVGIAAATRDYTSWEQLLSHADEAMYLAKRSGKDRAEVYIPVREIHKDPESSLKVPILSASL